MKRLLPISPIPFTRALIPALSLAMLAVSCGSAVYWLRQLTQPLPTAHTQVQARHREVGAAAAELFGNTPFDPLTSITLTGVLGPAGTSTGKWQAVAVVKIADAAPMLAAPGATLLPGVTLEQVQHNAILVSSAGRTQEIRLSSSPRPAQGWLY